MEAPAEGAEAGGSGERSAADPPFRYAAFISYNHRDRRWASWLHRSLERYRVPRQLHGLESPLGTLGRRLPPVFQDREELAAASDLAQSVKDALAQSACLIVVCSPNAVRSRWVEAEIRTFRALGRGDRIQCVIVPSDEPESAPVFPAPLIEGGTEPLAADARRSGDGARPALIKLIAGLLGVRYDLLRQREATRRQRRLAIVAGASLAGFVGMSGLAGVALISRQEAVHQRDVARQKTVTAERTTEFVKGLFEISDPSEAQGAKVTALEVLDKGARQIEQSLAEEPDVRAALATTLSEVYMNLGAYRRADAIVRRSLGWGARDPAVAARQRAVLGDSLSRQSAYEAAVGVYSRALPRARAAGEGGRELLSRILVGRAEALAALDQFGPARRDVTEALKVDRAHLAADDPAIARDLETAGLIADFEGKIDEARRRYTRALAIRLKRQGQLHPRVAEDYNELGTLAYLQHDSAAAERYVRKAAQADEIVLGPDHPDVALTLNTLARIILERRGFAEALPLLERSAPITVAQRGRTSDDMAFIASNLAIARRGLGDLAGAEAAFRQALQAAELHKHRNLAPVLADLAEVRCAGGDTAGGLTLLARAGPIMRADYPDDPWRSAWVESTRGACLSAAGRLREALPLIRTSTVVLRARWGPKSLYGYQADKRLAAANRLASAR